MIAQWILDVIVKLHQYGIKQKELAAYIGYNEKYICTVLSGKQYSPKAEKKIREGLDAMIAERTAQAAPEAESA